MFRSNALRSMSRFALVSIILVGCGRTELYEPEDPDAGDASTPNTMTLVTDPQQTMAPCDEGKHRCQDGTCIANTDTCPVAATAAAANAADRDR